MGKVKVPAARAVVLSVTNVSSTDTPRRCHSMAPSPLQNWICSAVGAPGRIAACKAPASPQHAFHRTMHITLQGLNDDWYTSPHQGENDRRIGTLYSPFCKGTPRAATCSQHWALYKLRTAPTLGCCEGKPTPLCRRYGPSKTWQQVQAASLFAQHKMRQGQLRDCHSISSRGTPPLLAEAPLCLAAGRPQRPPCHHHPMRPGRPRCLQLLLRPGLCTSHQCAHHARTNSI